MVKRQFFGRLSIKIDQEYLIKHIEINKYLKRPGMFCVFIVINLCYFSFFNYHVILHNRPWPLRSCIIGLQVRYHLIYFYHHQCLIFTYASLCVSHGIYCIRNCFWQMYFCNAEISLHFIEGYLLELELDCQYQLEYINYCKGNVKAKHFFSYFCKQIRLELGTLNF